MDSSWSPVLALLLWTVAIGAAFRWSSMMSPRAGRFDSSKGIAISVRTSRFRATARVWRVPVTTARPEFGTRSPGNNCTFWKTRMRRPKSGDRRVQSVAFSRDGQLLAMASAEGSVVIWDATDGRRLETLEGHSNAVWAVAFSPDGRTLASGGEDLTIRLWNVATWRNVMVIRATDSTLGGGVREMSFSPDGHRLLAAGRPSLIYSAPSPDGRAKQLARQLSDLLQSKADFRNRVQMISEDPDLPEAVEILSQTEPDSDSLQVAQRLAQANSHASKQQWPEAVEHLDWATTRGEAPESWFRTAGLLRLATALYHQGRSADAVALLSGSAVRRDEEGLSPGSEHVGLGIGFSTTNGQVKVTGVIPQSPADRAGLTPGDIILQIDDTTLVGVDMSRAIALIAGPAGSQVRLDVRRAGSETTESIELTRALFLRDPETGAQVRTLKSAIESRLGDTPKDVDLLELRAELAGHWNGVHAQIADYTAALAILAQRSEDAKDETKSRLHRRRGDVYVQIGKWQQAIEDYEQVVGEEASHDGFLENQALAQANLETRWTTLTPVEMSSEGQASFELQDDGSLFVSGNNPDVDVYTILAPVPSGKLTAVKLDAIPDPRLPNGGSGRAPNGNFRLAEVQLKLRATDDNGEKPSRSRSSVATRRTPKPRRRKLITHGMTNCPHFGTTILMSRRRMLPYLKLNRRPLPTRCCWK